MAQGPNNTASRPGLVNEPLRTLAGFVCGTVVWMALFTIFVAFYPSAWGYGMLQAVLTAVAWCVSCGFGAAAWVLVARERSGVRGARWGLVLGFVVAGGGLLYSVTGHRPAGSDAWPTDLLLWAVAVGLAMTSGAIGGWITGAALSRRG